ncbi:MAG: hypothetical protein FJZ92_13355 [Chloroflexi bacterium]|nr:hypothetical protein [Chloroflexota bacterium]
MATDVAPPDPPAESQTPRGRLVDLALAGVVLEVALLVGFLWPLAIWKHHGIVEGHQPLAVVLGTGRIGAVRYLVIVLCAFAAFAAAAWLARRVAGRPALWIVLGGVVVFSATLIPINPVGAHDVYHNIADARTLWVHGDNPMTTPPEGNRDDPFYPHVPAWADYASSYGPLWYVISGAPLPFAGSSLWPNVIGQKLIATAFLVIATTLVMLIAGRIRPGTAIPAGVLVGWNPLMLFETAGNAHNDIVMAAFALAAFYAIVRKWWTTVFPLLALAVAVKYTLIVLAPLVMIWMVLRTDIPLRALARSLAAGLAVGLALFGPVIVDGSLYHALARQGDHILASTGSALVSLLIEYRGMDVAEATYVMKVALGSLFLLGYGVLIWRLPRNPSFATLTNAASWMIFLFLFTASWWFWPWYLVWLVPFAALRPHRAPALAASVFATTAMLMYLSYYWQLYSDWHFKQRLVAATIFTAPMAIALLQAVRPWLQSRLRGLVRSPAAPDTAQTQRP